MVNDPNEIMSNITNAKCQNLVKREFLVEFIMGTTLVISELNDQS